MHPAVVIVIILIALGGILPLIGLARVAIRAHGNLPDADTVSAVAAYEEGAKSGIWSRDAFVPAAMMADTSPVLEWNKVKWDLGLVGGGVVLATIASAWSIFL